MNEHLPFIAHFDLDAFFVSVEILKNPSLKGKPVLVGGYDRGVVAACSYEARKFGIQSAMPMQKALQLCPQAIVTNASRGEYSKYSKWVTSIIEENSPQFEKASIDEFYVDLSGMEKYFGATNFAKKLRTKISKETGLPISCGLASSRYIAKMATNEAKPNGFLQIEHGKEKEFLWPLPIEKINGVGFHTEQLLKSYSINYISDIAKTPVEVMQKIAGKWGKELWHKSQGIGNSKLVTDWNQKSFSNENTFHQNYTDKFFLENELVRLTERTAYLLRKENKMTGCITVKIRYDNFETINKQESIDFTALDDVLIAKVKDIFRKQINHTKPVRLLGVKFSHLVIASPQMSLFENNMPKLKLYQVVDSLKNKFGKNVISKASVIKKSNK